MVPSVVFKVFLFGLEVGSNLVAPFCRQISQLHWLQGQYVGSKALRCGEVYKYPSVVAKDMDVEGFISDRVYALHHIPINQYVIDDFIASLVSGEIREAVSFQTRIY